MRKAQCIARPEKQGETICAPSHQQSICGECCNARPSGFTDTANCLMYQDPHCITASAICLAILHRKKNKVPKVPKCQVPNTFQISLNCLFYYFLLCFGTLALWHFWHFWHFVQDLRMSRNTISYAFRQHF